MAATAVFLLSLLGGNIRGIVWIVVLVLDAVASDAYKDAGLPFPDAVMATADFTMCVALYYIAAHRWELWLFVLMQFSMLVSIVYLAGTIIAGPDWIDVTDYLSVLELINYAAIILIGGVTGFVVSGHFNGTAFAPWRRVLPFSGLLRRNVAKGK